jgi:hypothetical protein
VYIGKLVFKNSYVGARSNVGVLTIFNLELFYRTIILKTSNTGTKTDTESNKIK